MSALDWIVLGGTLLFIVGYGTWKTRGSRDMESYLRGDNSSSWWTICLSIMATQASAITFLSTPGQAFEDGMRFVQFYFGLPLAMVIISITAVPIFYRLKVYTAYEFLENRFDLKTRSLTAFLFLVQRGLAAGITIYAPAIILSSILGWNLNFTVIGIGALVTIYTVAGGTKAVNVTQKQQMAVMMGGMLIAGIIVWRLLPNDVSFGEAVQVAGKMGKMNVVDFSFSLQERYTFWSGITGGLFLALSYFGTDQSQVARYLTGSSIAESRTGLLFNGLLKIPMQFFILFIGVLVFVFYQFNKPPVFFNEVQRSKLENSSYAPQLKNLEAQHTVLFQQKQDDIKTLLHGLRNDDETQIKAAKISLNQKEDQIKNIREDVKTLIKKNENITEVKDTDYVFISFVMKYLPQGIIGLLIAVILCAAMSSTASELNALASTTVVDIYKRSVNKSATEKHYVRASKAFTLAWGAMAIFFATVASMLDNLIQAVNLLGSLFYGTILGIFLVAFYIKPIRGNAVFVAALLAEFLILALYFLGEYNYLSLKISFLWFNVIGCALVVLFGFILQMILPKNHIEI
ncbi:MAG: sodium:solute symporter [Sphingobacteriales bacterium]|nr:MAG: sodium:solute symporter [Sphingobacteriales bacterium]